MGVLCSPRVFLVAAATLLASVSCSETTTACVEIDPECQPLYEPTYEQIFTRTLKPTCGVGSRCHSAAGRRGGLVFEDLSSSHEDLLESGVVKPGDAACSKLVRRIESRGSAQMPPAPADPLSAGERCAIEKWISEGATP